MRSVEVSGGRFSFWPGLYAGGASYWPVHLRADALIIVAPEYNNGYPGVLKNALDYLLPEYERKPIGIVTVSAGGFGVRGSAEHCAFGVWRSSSATLGQRYPWQ